MTHRILLAVVPRPYRRRIWELYVWALGVRTSAARLSRTTVRVLSIKIQLVAKYQGFRRSPVWAIHYLLFGREFANFTYKIGNTRELAGIVADVTGASPETAFAFIRELEDDATLRAALIAAASRDEARHAGVEYGRRLGWYALARITRPQLIVETGVDAGLGSAVLLRALQRNADDGAAGRLISIDIRPDVGSLVDESLRRGWTLLVGDSLRMLETLRGEVGVFIHDSAHTYEHELAELRAIEMIRAPGAVLVSDNAHGSSALRDYCTEKGLAFFSFREKPRHHFYPGAVLGAARFADRPSGREG